MFSQGEFADGFADGHLPEGEGARAGEEAEEHREPGWTGNIQIKLPNFGYCDTMYLNITLLGFFTYIRRFSSTPLPCYVMFFCVSCEGLLGQ